MKGRRAETPCWRLCIDKLELTGMRRAGSHICPVEDAKHRVSTNPYLFTSG